MKTELVEVSAVRKRLTVDVPASDVEAVYDKLVRRYRKTASIPGFRPGKAPLELVRRRIGDSLDHEAAEEIVDEFGREAVKQEGLSPIWTGIDLPEGLDHIPHPHKGEDYQFTLLLDLLPEFELQEYVGIEIGRPPVVLTDEEVEKELEELRQSQGKLTEVTDRPSANDDLVVVELEGLEVDGDFKVEKSSRVFKLGVEKNGKEFDEQLKNRMAGEAFDFTVTYPETAPETQLAGKTIAFNARLKEIRVLAVPEWTTELAQTLWPEVEGVDDLRAKVREVIKIRKEREADNMTRWRLTEWLVDHHQFEAPESMTEHELEGRLDRIGHRLQSQGLDPKTLDVNWEEVVKEQREQAKRDVRLNLILEKIAEKEAEAILVSAADIEQAIGRMARDLEVEPRALRNDMVKHGRLGALEREILRQKCLDWVYSKAHIV